MHGTVVGAECCLVGMRWALMFVYSPNVTFSFDLISKPESVCEFFLSPPICVYFYCWSCSSCALEQVLEQSVPLVQCCALLFEDALNRRSVLLLVKFFVCIRTGVGAKFASCASAVLSCSKSRRMRRSVFSTLVRPNLI